MTTTDTIGKSIKYNHNNFNSNGFKGVFRNFRLKLKNQKTKKFIKWKPLMIIEANNNNEML